MSSELKIVAASIVNFLKQQLDGDGLSPDSRESVEVGVQCIETAFELTSEETARGLDLLQLVRQRLGPPANKAEAERLKNEGNELMKAERFREALDKYTRAIEIDQQNAVYFCNRAAAHFKLCDLEASVADCTAALALQPDYSKAYGRLGLALTALERHSEARAAYARAAQLDPNNESYRENLLLADQTLAQQRPNDLSGLLRNPALINMATEMLTDPNMQTLISGLMSTTAGGAGVGEVPPGGINTLLEVGQTLAQQMQAANPELVEQLRRQMRPPGSGENQPPSQ